jgi:hypothetical protein
MNMYGILTNYTELYVYVARKKGLFITVTQIDCL